MLRPESRTTISMKSFGGLIRANSVDAAKRETEYRSVIKSMEQGDFSGMKQLVQVVKYLIEHDLEGIKQYAQKDEYQRIALLDKFIQFSIKGKLNPETKKRLNKDVKAILKDLKKELKNERRMKKRGKPRAGIINSFKRERGLARKTRKKSKHLASLDMKINTEVAYISNLARTNRYAELKEAVLKLSALFLEFFDTILEIDKETEMQEFEIIRELTHLKRTAKRNENFEAEDQLDEIIRSVKTFFKKDFMVAKREFKEANKLAA